MKISQSRQGGSVIVVYKTSTAFCVVETGNAPGFAKLFSTAEEALKCARAKVAKNGGRLVTGEGVEA